MTSVPLPVAAFSSRSVRAIFSISHRRVYILALSGCERDLPTAPATGRQSTTEQHFVAKGNYQSVAARGSAKFTPLATPKTRPPTRHTNCWTSHPTGPTSQPAGYRASTVELHVDSAALQADGDFAGRNKFRRWEDYGRRGSEPEEQRWRWRVGGGRVNDASQRRGRC